MKTLKDVANKVSKEGFYEYYKIIIKSPKSYAKITKMQMYQEVIEAFKEDPEIILNLCNAEEINILQSLLEKPRIQKKYGYIEYTLFFDLFVNYLVGLENKEYFIYEDIYNYVKMALNLYNKKEHDLTDFYSTVIIGLTHIYNVLELDLFIELLHNYNIKITKETFITSLHDNRRLYECVDIVKLNKKSYVISKDYPYFEEVLEKRLPSFSLKKYTLEETLSIGKYHLNLFNPNILNFINYLEMHMEPMYIFQVINDMVACRGLGFTDEQSLRQISDNINDLYQEISKNIADFPCWIA